MRPGQTAGSVESEYILMAYVHDTKVNISGAQIFGSVFGGGANGHVSKDTEVNISGGEIGRNEVNKNSDNPGYTMFGGMTMGNVFGGGMGKNTNTLLGVVKGNTNVTIKDNVADATYAEAHEGVNAGDTLSSPKIYHNIYGGGALASVGTFGVSDGVTKPVMNHVPKGIPFGWTSGTGIAKVTITGGTIGISGRDNGMVYGSSRGDIAKPVETILGSSTTHILKDPYDKMAWVESTIVNIGTEGATTGPHIKGSVYGGGESGHVFTHANVYVKSGTIGIVDENDPWFDFGNSIVNETAWTTRGNVYGAGCGTDTYTDDHGKELHNSWAGCVVGNTNVNISGGWIAQSVYGGGSLGSVGNILNDPSQPDQQHHDATKGFALSWPAIIVYSNLSSGDEAGVAKINITGGRIGTTGSDNGDVFGGARGEAGDPYENAPFGNVKRSEVTINYGSTPTDKEALALVENIEEGKAKFSVRIKDGINAICGSVYGGAENGHVYENTNVEIKNGLIGHAVYGGGKGKGMYNGNYSLTAGKVYGNTTVTMTNGHVIRNIYGGGNLGSIGKGNYADGSNDYYTHTEYGETIEGNLWPEGNDPGNADFLGSGKTYVNIIGGVVGFDVQDNTDVVRLDGNNKPTINAGTLSTLFPTADSDLTKKLIKVFSKDDLPTGNVFGGCRGEAAAENDMTGIRLGYVNETHVNIGREAKDAVGTQGQVGYTPAETASSPRIYGSVYGGGQDGHVRRGTDVNINMGEIGIPYNEFYQGYFGTDLDDLNWLHRGNIYGGGSGIGMYKDNNNVEHNSSSAGSVMKTTNITIGKGIKGVAGTGTEPGNVIYRNVYGGGSLASVCNVDGSVNTTNPPHLETREGWKFGNTVTVSGTVGVVEGYNQIYGGEVYGGGRGEKVVKSDYPQWFALSVWTRVKILNGANIMGNVFGGGDAGVVNKDSDVIVGGE